MTISPTLWRVELDVELPSANVALRKHWRWRRSHTHDMLLLILSRSVAMPAEPICPAHVRITQHRKRLLDPDALGMTVKPLLDILTMPIGRKTYGLSVIRDDRAATMSLELLQVKAPRGEAARVVVEVSQA
jgi:hypothetical protein